MKRLFNRAAEVLRGNDRGSHTVPAPNLYPLQWAWDSAFAAIGWACIDPPRGLREMRSLLEGQWEDGRIPHIRFDPHSSEYFPGPELWGSGGTSSITQPPVFALALRSLLEAGVDRAAIRELLPAIERAHTFFLRERDPLGWNLVAVVHPWESGLDNNPAWDAPLRAVDPSQAPPFQRTDIKWITDTAERPTDDEYRRYVVLVRQIAESGFRSGSFFVYDPLMSGLLARAEEELTRLAGEVGYSRREPDSSGAIRSALVERLWSGELGRFRYYDTLSGEWSAPDVLAAHYPAVLDLPAAVREAVSENLGRHFQSPWPLPSTSPGAPEYDPLCYWRGPVWVNMNWLFLPLFGDALRDRTLEMVDRFGFHEYFHPETGRGLGADSFTWTAALVLEMLAKR